MATAAAPLNRAITLVGSFGRGDDNVPASDDGLSQKASSEMRASSPTLIASVRRNNNSNAAVTLAVMMGATGRMINQREKAALAISHKPKANPTIPETSLTPPR